MVKLRTDRTGGVHCRTDNGQFQSRTKITSPGSFTMLIHLVLVTVVLAAEPADLKNIPLPTALLEPEGKLQVAAGICFLEGPAVDAEQSIFFSDIAGNRIL